MRVGHVALANGKKTTRGVEMGIGDPQQRLAFLPQWWQDGYLIYGPDGHCDALDANYTKEGCATFRGGSFNGSASKSRNLAGATEGDLFSANDEAKGWPENTRFLDTLTLNSNISLPRFPMRTPLKDWGQQAYFPMNAFGLGTNSSLLKTLKSSGRIGSRSWSISMGTFGGRDGSLVLGGYDKARVKADEKKYTQSLTPEHQHCASGIVVTVTDLVLNLPGGPDVSLFPTTSQSSALTACVNPSLPVLVRLRLDPYVSTLLSKTNSSILSMDRSFGVNWYNLRYKKGQTPYGGALTVKFQNGFSARIENNELVVPHPEIDKSTGDILSETPPDLLVDSMQQVNANDMAQIGMHFFASAAVLMVNHDAGQFTIWAGLGNGAAGGGGPAADLVAVDATNRDVAGFCATNTTSPPPPPVETLPSGTSRGPGSPDQSGASETPAAGAGGALSTGALVGIAAGGVTALFFAVGIAVWLLRRHGRRAGPAAAPRGGKLSREAAGRVGGADGHPTKPELLGSTPTGRQYSAMSGYTGKSELHNTSPTPIHEAHAIGVGPRPDMKYELSG